MNKCLRKVADAMYTRLIIEFNVTRVRDFSKNIKTLSAKYFYHEPLFTSFCRLVERDIDENCYCSKELSFTKFVENGTYRNQNLANSANFGFLSKMDCCRFLGSFSKKRCLTNSVFK